jgi:hypothetical protein
MQSQGRRGVAAALRRGEMRECFVGYARVQGRFIRWDCLSYFGRVVDRLNWLYS